MGRKLIDKAEQEVLQAIKETQEYIAENYLGEIPLLKVRELVKERISGDTRFRYESIVEYYLNWFDKVVNAQKEKLREKKNK